MRRAPSDSPQSGVTVQKPIPACASGLSARCPVPVGGLLAGAACPAAARCRKWRGDRGQGGLSGSGELTQILLPADARRDRRARVVGVMAGPVVPRPRPPDPRRLHRPACCRDGRVCLARPILPPMPSRLWLELDPASTQTQQRWRPARRLQQRSHRGARNPSRVGAGAIGRQGRPGADGAQPRPSPVSPTRR